MERNSVIRLIVLFLFWFQCFLQAQEIESYPDEEIDSDKKRTNTNLNKYITCPIVEKSCEISELIIIENEDAEDYSVTEIRGIKYFNLIKAIKFHVEKSEYTEFYNATMCISIEPILIGEGIIEMRNRKTNSTIRISVNIIKPQISFSGTLFWITLVIPFIQSIIIGSFLDSKRLFSTFKSIFKCENTWKLVGYLLVAFTRIIVALIVS